MSAFLAQGQCEEVQDASYVDYYGPCGSNEWELGVTWGGGVEDYFDEDEAFGACNGDITDCAGDYEDAGYDNGQSHYFDDGPLGDYAEEVHWTLDDWTVTTGSCNDPNHPTWEYQINTNDPYETQEFEVDCE